MFRVRVSYEISVKTTFGTQKVYILTDFQKSLGHKNSKNNTVVLPQPSETSHSYAERLTPEKEN